LSTLVILFVATMSFKPLPAEKTMEKLVDGTISLLLDSQKPEKMTPERIQQVQTQRGVYHLKKVELLRGEPDSPDSDYRLILSLQFPNPEQAAASRQDPREAV